MQRIIPIFTSALATIFLLPQSVEAQAEMRIRAQGEKPTFEDLQSPQIQTQTRDKRWTPKDWLEIEASIKVETSPVPPSEMLDRLTVKWYVAIANPDKRGEFLLLTREVNHVNVPIKDSFNSSVYLSPSSVRRITGNYRNPKKSVESVGYEVIHNGEVIAHSTNKGQDQWWNIPSERISASDSVPLMTKPETPFAAMWWDRYAEVAVEK